MDLKKDQLFLASEYIKKCVNRFHFELGNFKLLLLRVGTGMCTILFVISKASWKLTILMLGGTSFIMGAILISFGLKSFELYQKYTVVLLHLTTLPVFAAIVGLALVILGFMGFISSILASRAFIIVYITTIIVTLIGGIIFYPIASYGLQKLKKIPFNELLQTKIPSYGKISEVTHAFDFIHHKLGCCGANGASDFAGVKMPPGCNSTSILIRMSRFPREVKNSTDTIRGCADVIRRKLTYVQTNTNIATIGIYIILLWALVCAFQMLFLLRSQVQRHPAPAANMFTGVQRDIRVYENRPGSTA